MRNIKGLFLILVVFSVVSFVNGQENGSLRPSNEIKMDLLQKKLGEQELLLTQLQETLMRQSELLKRQQEQLERLQGKKDQESTKPAIVPAKSDATAGKDVAKSATEKPNTASMKSEKGPDKSVDSGFGKIKFHGLIQGWYTAGNGVKNTLRFRRAELKFTGQINPKVKWTLMIDPAKALSVNTTSTTIGGVPVITSVSPNQSSRILQDLFITLNYIKNVSVDVGQYKVPLSQEGLQSSGALDTVERALFMSDRSRGGGLGDIRDFGIQFSGPIGKYFDYRVGVFNGTGENQNIADTNQEKAIIGRFVVRPPFIKGLQLGVSGAWSNYDRVTNARRDRFGGDLIYVNKKAKFKAEVMGGVDGDLHRLGYYTHFGYRITPKIEAIFRVDGFDPDRRRETNALNVAELDYVGGFNYYITENNFKFQFNYIRKTFNNGIQSPKNLFLANLQTSW